MKRINIKINTLGYYDSLRSDLFYNIYDKNKIICNEFFEYIYDPVNSLIWDIGYEEN